MRFEDTPSKMNHALRTTGTLRSTVNLQGEAVEIMPEAASTVRERCRVVCDYYPSGLPDKGRILQPPGVARRPKPLCPYSPACPAEPPVSSGGIREQNEVSPSLPPSRRDGPKVRNLGFYWPRADHMLS